MLFYDEASFGELNPREINTFKPYLANAIIRNEQKEVDKIVSILDTLSDPSDQFAPSILLEPVSAQDHRTPIQLAHAVGFHDICKLLVESHGDDRIECELLSPPSSTPVVGLTSD
jgi:hypothetical protein